MEITEVRVRLVRESSQDKLRAFVTMTFDNDFVVREVKVIEGDQGLFVAMPSRKSMERCRHCGGRNVVQANYCNQCGKSLPKGGGPRDSRDKVYLDVAHPINSRCRKQIHDAVVAAYREECEREAADSEPESSDTTGAASDPASDAEDAEPEEAQPSAVAEASPRDPQGGAADENGEADEATSVAYADEEEEDDDGSGQTARTTTGDDAFDKGIFR